MAHGGPHDDCPACQCPAATGAAGQSALQKSDALDILSLLGLLALVIALNTMVKKRGWPVPPAILTMGVSVAVGAMSSLLPEPAVRGFRRLDEVAAMQFLTVWLAPIIFAEGYAMRTKQFFDNIVRIVAHAFVGTTVSAVVVALCVRFVPAMLGSTDQFSIGECLAFGALISATDPVTTLAIFKEQRMAENGLGHLYYTVLGESVLNDAVGIVLFTMFSKLVRDGKDVMGVADVADIAKEFTSTFVGSMIIGLSLGCLMPLVLKYTPLAHKSSKPSLGTLGSLDEVGTKGILDDDSDGEDELEFNVPEVGVALVLGMIPYLLAEACDLSGIVAIMFAGMVARYYAHHNLTKETRQIFLPTVELVAQLCETYVFIILGLGTFLFEGAYSLPLIVATVLGCLLGRAAHVYPLSAAVNCCSKSKTLQTNEQHMVCFAGLRGAIAFICAFSFPQTSNPQHRYDVIRTTTVIVGLSLLGLGWPTSAMMRWLDIRAQEAPPLCFVAPAAGSGPRTPRCSHRRARSDTPALQEKESCQSPRSGSGGVVGCFRRLDFSLRRFLMTKDAIYEVNHARFRRLKRSAGVGASGRSNHRPAKSWGGMLPDGGNVDVEGRGRAWSRDSCDASIDESEDGSPRAGCARRGEDGSPRRAGARRGPEPQAPLKEPLLPAMRPAELPAHGRSAAD